MNKCITSLIVGMLLLGLTGCQNRQNQDNQNQTTETETFTESSSVASVKTVSAGDMEMDYIEFGTGKKNFVILPGLSVHSVMGSSDAIADAYKDFADEYTVYVFDRPKDIHDGYTVRDMAEDTAAAMKALNMEDADIFGASQGGMIAMYLAIDYPDLVNKMILGSTLAKPNDTFNRVIDEWEQLAEKKDERGLLESFADNVYSAETLKAYRDTLISSNLGISDEEYQRFSILADACKTFNCYDELSSIQCPVLVLGSKGDHVATAKGSKQIARALGCEIYLYDDNYGHGVYDEAPDYKQRCLDFLTDANSSNQ